MSEVLCSVFSGLELIYFYSKLAHSFSETTETFNIHRFYGICLTRVFIFFFLLSVFLSWNFIAFSFLLLVTFHFLVLVLPRSTEAQCSLKLVIKINYPGGFGFKYSLHVFTGTHV